MRQQERSQVGKIRLCPYFVSATTASVDWKAAPRRGKLSTTARARALALVTTIGSRCWMACRQVEMVVVKLPRMRPGKWMEGGRSRGLRASLSSVFV